MGDDMANRYCLIDGARKKRVHKVRDDEASMTRCGQYASKYDRYSRRDVAALKNLPFCGTCARVK